MKILHEQQKAKKAAEQAAKAAQMEAEAKEFARRESMQKN